MHRNLQFFLDHSCCKMKANLNATPSRFNNKTPSKNDFFINNVPPASKPVSMMKSFLHSPSRFFAQRHTKCRTEQQEASKKFQKPIKPKKSDFLNDQTQYSIPVRKSSLDETFKAVNHPQKLKSNQFSSCCNSDDKQPIKKMPWTSYNSRSASFSYMNQTPPILLNYKLMCKVCLQEKYRCICSKLFCG